MYFIDYNHPGAVYVGGAEDFNHLRSEGGSPLEVKSPFFWDKEASEYWKLYRYPCSPSASTTVSCEVCGAASHQAICSYCLMRAYRKRCKLLTSRLKGVAYLASRSVEE